MLCYPIAESVVTVYSKGSWIQFDVDQVLESTGAGQQVGGAIIVS